MATEFFILKPLKLQHYNVEKYQSDAYSLVPQSAPCPENAWRGASVWTRLLSAWLLRAPGQQSQCSEYTYF